MRAALFCEPAADMVKRQGLVYRALWRVFVAVPMAAGGLLLIFGRVLRQEASVDLVELILRCVAFTLALAAVAFSASRTVKDGSDASRELGLAASRLFEGATVAASGALVLYFGIPLDRPADWQMAGQAALATAGKCFVALGVGTTVAGTYRLAKAFFHLDYEWPSPPAVVKSSAGATPAELMRGVVIGPPRRSGIEDL